MQTGSSGTLIGWKSGQTTFVPLWDRMEGAWLRTLVRGRGREGTEVPEMEVTEQILAKIYSIDFVSCRVTVAGFLLGYRFLNL